MSMYPAESLAEIPLSDAELGYLLPYVQRIAAAQHETQLMQKTVDDIAAIIVGRAGADPKARWILDVRGKKLVSKPHNL